MKDKPRTMANQSPLAMAIFLCIIFASTAAVRHAAAALEIHPLRTKTGSSGHRVGGLSCESWRFGVETNNIRAWKTIPRVCEGYVGHYMLGYQYRLDSAVVIKEAVEYTKGLKLAKDGKDVWVFDIDETSLSNLPYYAHHGFGVEPFNATAFDAWVATSMAPALPETLNLYKKLVSLGIKIVFLTGRTEDSRETTVANLKRVGYHTWEKLLLKEVGVKSTALEFKSGVRQKLVKQGYRIVGNIGDQWSDILGSREGERTFKLPDPMYYLS